jgi:uncharacterized protein YukE
MSKKDVDKYYNTITEQYHEMLQDIKDFEKEASEGIVEPERVERLKEQIAPIKQNWERWTYMMFLLNQPERKSKHKGYQERNKKLLNTLSSNNSLTSVLEENDAARKTIGN